MSAYVITGIGFLGAGMILKDGKHGISGLTTAASVWTTAVGVAIANNLYVIAAAGTLILVVAPLIPHPHSVEEKMRE